MQNCFTCEYAKRNNNNNFVDRCSGFGNCSYSEFEGETKPDLRDKIDEYIKELETEINRLAIELEAKVNRMNMTYVACIKTRIDSYINVINDLKNRLMEVE